MDGHYSLNQDLKEAEAMAGSLADYLCQDRLYGSAGGGMFSSGKLPSLTVGALLMRLRRLDALSEQLDNQQLARLQKAQEQHEAVVDEWRVHYQQKMLREANSRLDSILPFFTEYRKDPDFGAQVYKPEAMRRTIVQELLPAIDEHNLDTEILRKKLTSVDGLLHSCLGKSDFLWGDMLQPVYAETTFWWLYRRPVAQRKFE
jgi:hypothetical protein